MIISHGMKIRRFDRLREALARLSLGNHIRKITILNVFDSSNAHFVDGIEAIFVHTTGFENAVGSDDDGSWESAEFEFLDFWKKRGEVNYLTL